MERSRRRTGVPQRVLAPHVRQVSADSARHFAFGYGDDNPLYCDPECAGKARWGGVVAPPLFLYCVGENAVTEWTAEQAGVLKGDPFKRFSSYQSSVDFEFYRPLRAGDRCRVLRAQVAVRDRSRERGRPAATVVNGTLFANGDGAIVAVHRVTWDYEQRQQATAPPGPEQVAATGYSETALAAIDAAYDAEARRGARPRYFEDVRVGDLIEPRVKGPLVLTDIVVWHVGWGMQFTPPGAFALSRRVRKKAPGLFPCNPRNVPDTVQRLHWDPERARETGLVTSRDYGAMRESWLSHALTDWAGDDGWLFRLTCEHPGTNYLGDTSWIRGTVTGKAEVDGRREVRLALTCENQRGELTTAGTAVVLLPSRDAPAELPAPPRANLPGLLELEVSRQAGRE